MSEDSARQEAIARFALGCFWGPDARFGLVDGVTRTRVGYAGGTTPSPTYDHIGDHAETLEVAYDPEVVDYPQLIQVFFAAHDSTRPSPRRQYASIIFPEDDEQEDRALEALRNLSEEAGKPPATEVLRSQVFHSAEAYHQKFYLQQVRRIFDSLRRQYDDLWELVDSRPAARINGYIAGYGNIEDLEEEIDEMNLDPGGKDALLRLVRSRS